MNLNRIPARQVAIWLFFLILVGVIIGLERSSDDALKPRVDSHGHVISETRMLLPLPAEQFGIVEIAYQGSCLLYTSPSPRDSCASRMPSSA